MSTGSSATSSMGTGSSTTMSTTMGLMCSPLYQNGMKPEDSDSTGTVIIISLAIFISKAFILPNFTETILFRV